MSEKSIKVQSPGEIGGQKLKVEAAAIQVTVKEAD
jgi:hypothetical protein